MRRGCEIALFTEKHFNIVQPQLLDIEVYSAALRAFCSLMDSYCISIMLANTHAKVSMLIYLQDLIELGDKFAGTSKQSKSQDIFVPCVACVCVY